MTSSQSKHFHARVLSRRDLSPNLWVLRVDPGGPFKHLAGQYATLGLEQDGKRFERAYSIASSPYEDALEFFIELVPRGELTPDLFKLNPGDRLLCRKIAKGRFTLDLRSGRTQHLLVSTVTGVAPFVSVVRTLYHDWKSGHNPMPGSHRVYCLQGASHSREFGYREELERYAAEVPWLKYVATVSRPWEDAEWRGERGRVDDVLRKYADAWGLLPDETTAYLCGHPLMTESCRGILSRTGWKSEAIFEEAYFQAAKEASAAPPADGHERAPANGQAES